jgi:hypothetical protein
MEIYLTDLNLDVDAAAIAKGTTADHFGYVTIISDTKRTFDVIFPFIVKALPYQDC